MNHHLKTSSIASLFPTQVLDGKLLASVVACVLVISAASLTGCTRGAAPSPESNQQTTDETPTEPPLASKNDESDKVDQQAAADSPEAVPEDTELVAAKQPDKNQLPIEFIDPQGQRYFGTIALSLFQDDPTQLITDIDALEQTRSRTPASGPSTAGTKPAMADSKTPSDSKPIASTDGATSFNWQKLITAVTIDAELKRIRNQLTNYLGSVGRYNQNFEKIQVESATLAALALIAGDYPSDNRWKERAPFIVHHASGMELAADGRGRAAFTKTEAHFQELLVVLNGGQPTSEIPTDDESSWADRASRESLMRRMQTGFDWLQSNVNSAATIDSGNEEAKENSAVLSALVQVIGHESYDLADDESYQKYVAETLSGLAEMKNGIKMKSFEQYDVGFQKLKASCNACHQEYRF